jgi:prolipoprotein diacylglyceryltransferase
MKNEPGAIVGLAFWGAIIGAIVGVILKKLRATS